MRIRLHWLLITTAVFSIICWIGAMWALERANRRAYDRDTQALIDAGFVMDWDTVAADIAPTDPTALATWTAWCAHVPRVEEDSSLFAWIRNGRGAPPPAAQVLVDTHRAAMASVLPLVRDGRLRFGLRARMHDWLSGPRDPHRLLSVSSGLIGTRALAQWLRWQALTAPDPTPWLDDLDRLVSGGDPSLCLIDSLIGNALATIRDEARFAHIRSLGGRLNSEHPWLTQHDLRGHSATLWMGERLLISSHVDHLLRTGDVTAWTMTRTGWQYTLWSSLMALSPRTHWQWATMPSGGAFMRWTHAKQEAHLRGAPPPAMPSGVGGEGNMIAAIALPEVRECHISLGEHHVRAHIVRLAARLLIDQRDGVAIPADAATLRAHYGNDVLAALPGSVPVLYTREADGGFTLAGDLSVPAGPCGMLRRDHRITITATDLTPEALPSAP